MEKKSLTLALVVAAPFNYFPFLAFFIPFSLSFSFFTCFFSPPPPSFSYSSFVYYHQFSFGAVFFSCLFGASAEFLRFEVDSFDFPSWTVSGDQLLGLLAILWCISCPRLLVIENQSLIHPFIRPSIQGFFRGGFRLLRSAGRVDTPADVGHQFVRRNSFLFISNPINLVPIF